MHSFVAIVGCLLLSIASIDFSAATGSTTLSCYYTAASSVQRRPMPGGWSSVNLTTPLSTSFNSTKNFANSTCLSSLRNRKPTITARQLVEAYQQVVAGTNYCLRFNATIGNGKPAVAYMLCDVQLFHPLPGRGVDTCKTVVCA